MKTGNTGSKNRILSMVMIALMSVIITICSWISIPGPVPFTLQTFAVFAALLILGARDGTISIIVYLLLGAVGVPVFSGFAGGIGHLLGPTGGYLIGFIFMGLIFGLVCHFGKASLLKDILACTLGLLSCYAFGTAWFVIVYARNGNPVSITTALLWCVLPFLIPDAVKMALAVILSGRIKLLVPLLTQRK